MQYLGLTPSPPLDTFVERIWYCSDTPPHARERVLPSGGSLGLAINLVESELQIYDPENPGSVRAHAGALVCGTYTRSYLYDPRQRASVVGVHFQPGPEVRSFRPRFELWSDGASKQRFIWLPPGAQIDTSDMGSWQFPVGTKLWKEFTRDGVRVETRLLQRLPGGWIGLAYLWQEDGADASVAPQESRARQPARCRRAASRARRRAQAESHLLDPATQQGYRGRIHHLARQRWHLPESAALTHQVNQRAVVGLPRLDGIRCGAVRAGFGGGRLLVGAQQEVDAALGVEAA